MRSKMKDASHSHLIPSHTTSPLPLLHLPVNHLPWCPASLAFQNRGHSSFSPLPCCMSCPTILSSAFFPASLAFQNGGPVAVVWFWWVTAFFAFCLALSLAEISSSYPVSQWRREYPWAGVEERGSENEWGRVTVGSGQVSECVSMEQHKSREGGGGSSSSTGLSGCTSEKTTHAHVYECRGIIPTYTGLLLVGRFSMTACIAVVWFSVMMVSYTMCFTLMIPLSGLVEQPLQC